MEFAQAHRRNKGIEIAKTSRIIKKDAFWVVPSQNGKGTYNVQVSGFGSNCTCTDFELYKNKCKHIWAVELIRTGEVSTLEQDPTIKKPTYKQNWSNYDKAQTTEKLKFMQLLNDITSNIEEPEYSFGRPTLSQKDLFYSVIMKIYTTFSYRRFMSDIQIALDCQYISKKPCYASISHFLQREDITNTLIQLVKMTASPLEPIEKNFAIDSTGFGTSQFQRWFSFKHGKELCYRKWVKCHFTTGVHTNIIPAVKITTEFENDSPHLKELFKDTRERFDIEEFSGDKAYSSVENLEIINDGGAIPYIPFKKNVNTDSKHKRGMVWKKALHYFLYNQEEFMEHYHKRSNVETSVNMIKSKFGDFVRSKSWNAQINEVLCKVICHNICVVIYEMDNLNLHPNFSNIEYSIKA